MNQKQITPPTPQDQKPLDFKPTDVAESSDITEKIDAATKTRVRYWSCKGGASNGRDCGCPSGLKSGGYEEICDCGRVYFCPHPKRWSFPIEVDEKGNPIRGVDGDYVYYHPKSDNVGRDARAYTRR